MTAVSPEVLLARFKDIRARRTARQLEILESWLPRYRALIASGDRFNIFKALQVENDEIRHSRFLSFLLDPSSRHDQGCRFLRSFLDRVDFEGPHTEPTLEGCRVHAELPIEDLGRLDIAIDFPDGRVLAIENKVWAGEQPEQVARYQEWIRRKGRDAACRSMVVFLSPAGSMPETWDSISPVPVRPLSYLELADWLSGVTSGLPVRLKEVICMYSEVCRAIGRWAI